MVTNIFTRQSKCFNEKHYFYAHWFTLKNSFIDHILTHKIFINRNKPNEEHEGGSHNLLRFLRILLFFDF